MNRSPAIRGWKPEKPKRSSGLMLAAALCAAAMVAMSLTALRPREDAAALPQAMAAEEPAARPALPENIVTALPPGATRRLTITNQRLLQGRMLLVDEEHPIPEGVQLEDVFGVLTYARGRIACRDQQAALGRETLAALEDMCVHARNSGMSFITVFAGCRSREQQRLLLLEKVGDLSRSMTMEEAVAEAKRFVPPPGCSEHQLTRSVDIRICLGWNLPPRTEPLADSPQGAWVVAHAWEYGFIQRWPDADPALDDHRPYCFRYVGKTHALLMHALGMTMEEYLALLRDKGTVTLLDENGAPLATAMCAGAGERHTVFEAPADVELEDASLDNTGWAVICFTYPFRG